MESHPWARLCCRRRRCGRPREDVRGENRLGWRGTTSCIVGHPTWSRRACRHGYLFGPLQETHFSSREPSALFCITSMHSREETRRMTPLMVILCKGWLSSPDNPPKRTFSLQRRRGSFSWTRPTTFTYILVRTKTFRSLLNSPRPSGFLYYRPAATVCTDTRLLKMRTTRIHSPPTKLGLSPCPMMS